MKTQQEWDNFDKLRAGLIDAGASGINLGYTYGTTQVCVIGRAMRLGIIPERDSSGSLNGEYLRDIQLALGINADEARGLWSPCDTNQQFGPIYTGDSFGQPALDFALQRLKVLESRYTRPTSKKEKVKQMNKLDQLVAIAKQAEKLKKELGAVVGNVVITVSSSTNNTTPISIVSGASAIYLNANDAQQIAEVLLNILSSADMRDDA